MLVSKQCEYGVRLVRALVDGRNTVKGICDEQKIPYKFAFKIIKKLEKAGFVKGKRGNNGGYVLLKSLHDFTLFDVLYALDKNSYINKCLLGNSNCLRHISNAQCHVHDELHRIQKNIITELKSKSVAEVCNI